MKSYTDIEQSKKLAEILPIKSADAFYDLAEPEKRQVPIIGGPDDYYDMEDWTLPCWSLAALFELLPYPILSRSDVNNFCCKIFKGSIVVSSSGKNSIDACVEMIYKLKEKDLI